MQCRTDNGGCDLLFVRQHARLAKLRFVHALPLAISIPVQLSVACHAKTAATRFEPWHLVSVAVDGGGRSRTATPSWPTCVLASVDVRVCVWEVVLCYLDRGTVESTRFRAAPPFPPAQFETLFLVRCLCVPGPQGRDRLPRGFVTFDVNRWMEPCGLWSLCFRECVLCAVHRGVSVCLPWPRMRLPQLSSCKVSRLTFPFRLCVLADCSECDVILGNLDEDLGENHRLTRPSSEWLCAELISLLTREGLIGLSLLLTEPGSTRCSICYC